MGVCGVFCHCNGATGVRTESVISDLENILRTSKKVGCCEKNLAVNLKQGEIRKWASELTILVGVTPKYWSQCILRGC